MFNLKLAEILDAMITQKASSKANLFEEFTSGKSWVFAFKAFCNTYKSLAEHDALNMIPEMIDVFENKIKYVNETYFLNPALRESLLLELSKRRKEIGFDELERRYKKSNSNLLDRAR